MSNAVASKHLYTLFNYFIIFLGLLGCFRAIPANGQTKAHQLSRKFIIDPAYRTKPIPKLTKPGDAAWIYGYAEYESWRLQVMLENIKDAKLLVAYPGEHHTAYPAATFSAVNTDHKEVREIRFQSNAAAVVKADDVVIYESAVKSGDHVISFDKPCKINKLSFNLKTSAEPPAC